jgi:hypothetical protein
MVRLEPLDLYPKVSFAEPLSGRIFQTGERETQNALVVEKACDLLGFHLDNFYQREDLREAAFQ